MGNKDWEEVRFGDKISANPKVKIPKKDEVDHCLMEDIDPNFKFVYPAISKPFETNGAKFQNGDTLMARITPCLENGKIGQAKDFQGNVGVGSTEFFVFRGIEGVTDNDFVYYLCKSNLIRDTAVNSMAGASGRQRAVISVIENLVLKLPLLPTQQKIASILSAYDDLIENNRRRIGILEKMADGLYKEWFVRMRVSGVELEKDKETGLPVGWEVKKFTDEIKVLGGGTPKTENPNYWDGAIPWFNPQDLDGNYFVLETKRTITELGLKNCNSKLYEPGTVFITARGTVGKCVMAGVPMAMSQTSYALKSKGKLSQNYVFLTTLGLVEKFQQEAIGAVFDTITTSNFERTDIVVPDFNLLHRFENISNDIFNQIKTLQSQIIVLRRIRDRLLPRLMSGELPVAAHSNTRTNGLSE